MEKSVKNISLSILCVVFLFLSGCATITLPNYVSDEHPYKKTYYATFGESFTAVNEMLDDFHWKVTQTSDPKLYERNKAAMADNVSKQILIFTDLRTTSFGLGTRYSRVNVYLRTIADNETEIEIRYVTVTSIPFKSFYDFKKDKTVTAMHKHIDTILNSSS